MNTRRIFLFSYLLIFSLVVVLLIIRGLRNKRIRNNHYGQIFIGLGIIIWGIFFAKSLEIYSESLSSNAQLAPAINIEYWRARLTSTQDGFVAVTLIENDSGKSNLDLLSQRGKYGPLTIYQFKGGNFNTSPAYLNDDEKNEGYEWAATGEFIFDSMREYNVLEHKWSDWMPFNGGLGTLFSTQILRKNDGTWKTKVFDDYELTAMIIDLDDIPFDKLSENRIAIKQHLQYLSRKAQEYFAKSKSLGGGGYSFEGLTTANGLSFLPARSLTIDGNFSITTGGTKEVVQFQAIGNVPLADGSFSKYSCIVTPIGEQIVKWK